MCVPPVGTHSARGLLTAWCQQTAALDCAASARHTTRPCACAQVAQSAEQGTEKPRVGGSIPPLGPNNSPELRRSSRHCDSLSIASRASEPALEARYVGMTAGYRRRATRRERWGHGDTKSPIRNRAPRDAAFSASARASRLLRQEQVALASCSAASRRSNSFCRADESRDATLARRTSGSNGFTM